MRIQVVAEGLRFPEGLCWSERDQCLYFVEWSGDTILRLDSDGPQVIIVTDPGAGPCGLAQDRDGSLWACLYSARQLVQFGPDGTLRQVIDSCQGRPFKGPNDLVIDSRGGVYFTDSGDYGEDWVTGRPAGSVIYRDPAGGLQRVAARLRYPNGIALSADEKHLIVGESRRNRLLVYAIDSAGALSERRVLANLTPAGLLPPELEYELGPDGLCCDDRGDIWAAHFGGGRVVCVNLAGETLATIDLPRGNRPTNAAYDPLGRALYVTEAELGLLYRIDL